MKNTLKYNKDQIIKLHCITRKANYLLIVNNFPILKLNGIFLLYIFIYNYYILYT